jgi:hypothetical protein
LLSHVCLSMSVFHFSNGFQMYNTTVTVLHITASKSAQRVFKINMLFPSSVLCNSAGQGVLRQKVRSAVNALNRDWNFCSYSVEGLF